MNIVKSNIVHKLKVRLDYNYGLIKHTELPPFIEVTEEELEQFKTLVEPNSKGVWDFFGIPFRIIYK